VTERSAAPFRARFVLAALVIACLAFLPIANWIPGGASAPGYAQNGTDWIYGSAIAIGAGLILAISSTSRGLKWLWHNDAMARPIALFTRRPLAVSIGTAVVAFAAYALIARLVFAAHPLLIDEIVQMVQANMLAHGHLSMPVAAHPEFFSGINIVDSNGRYFAQFPIGGPAMLAIGVLLHAPWLVGPVFGAITVLAFSVYVRIAEPRPGIALGALLLLAFAPFTAFMAGSYMNHVTVLTWLVIAMAALAKVMTSETPRPWVALLSGLGFGIAATIRPSDAVAFALPAGAWYLWRALRTPARWRDALPAALGVALPLAVLLWANARTTGSPLLFGYELLWGKSHAIGFHTSPLGFSHTPLRGLELLNDYFLRLQTFFLETPVPSLVPAIVTLALTRKVNRFDRYLLASSALLVGLYWAYWHNGFYLGPRFMYPLLPVLAIFSARFFSSMRERFGDARAYRTAVYASLCALAMALVMLVPLRAAEYASQYPTMKWNANAAAESAGVRHALVFVRESWGARMVARLWALGVTRPQTELLYNHVDACRLDLGITKAEQNGLRGAAAFAALQPLLADSARTIISPYSPDPSERALPNTPYAPGCVANVQEDNAGFTLFLPLLLAHGGDNIYARDLGARDTLLMNRYPDRRVYLLRPATSKMGDLPRFYPMSRDSLPDLARSQGTRRSIQAGSAPSFGRMSTITMAGR